MKGSNIATVVVFLLLTKITWASVSAVLLSGFAVNISQAVSTALMLLLLGKPLLQMLERIKRKYGLLDLEKDTRKRLLPYIIQETHRHLAGARKTVNPPYGFVIGRIFAYCFDVAASKAPSDEGAVSEAD